MTKSEKTRKLIIEKSASLFNKKGVAATSLSDITQVTGLSKGSIYGNFNDKDEVALAVFEYNVNKVMINLLESVSLKDNAVDKLMEYPRYFRASYQDVFANGGCAILNTSVEADDNHKELKDLAAKVIYRWEAGMKKIINDGIKTGEIKAASDPDRYAALFIALFEGGVMLSKVTGEVKYLFYALEHQEYLILNHLKA